MRLSEIYLEHDRSCERREIACARAEARVEAAALSQTAQGTPEATQADSEPDLAAKPGSDVKATVAEYLAKFTKSA